MTSGGVININGGWTSKDGKNKIRFTQSLDKFEGYVGRADEVKISLGTISERTLNFKQTWHKGVNKGAVATVYGQMTSDGGTILLEFEGMRANGRGMKGRNAIYRENLVGSWITLGLGGSGDVWRFILGSNNQNITGYYFNSSLNDRVELLGQRINDNFFMVSLPSSEGRTTVVRGEYRCPNIILVLPPSLGNKTIILGRKPPECMPRYEEYEPQPMPSEESSAQTSEMGELSSNKRPFRGESNTAMSEQLVSCNWPSSKPESEDLRTPLMSCVSVPFEREQSQRNCCCGCNVL